MATNPMQRQKRNSFLLGMLLMLLISGIAIAVLIVMLKGKLDEEKAEKLAQTSVYVITTDVKSGQTITKDMLGKKDVNRNDVPSNAIGNTDVLDAYALQDKAGHNIVTEGNANSSKMYIELGGNNKPEVFVDDTTGNYYYEENNQQVFIELDQVALVAKVDMYKNTIITTEMLSKADSIITDDVRKQEYNMLSLPIDLDTGDYVDVRLLLPSGQDFIVISKKEVEVPIIGDVASEDTIWMNLSEDEILCMSCAIVEAYQLPAAKLYVNKYTEAGSQAAATPTYVPNSQVTELINSNPNVLDMAITELRARYSEANKSLRNNSINNAVSNVEDGESNLQTNMQTSITNTKTNRKSYLDSLAGVVE